MEKGKDTGALKLSIIVPVYQMEAGNKLAFCMDSLLNQTLAHEAYEIIAVDDCSPDGSYALLKQYAARFPGRIVVMQTPRNLRQGGAKNLGLTRARGKYIGFVDADDWVSPDCYQRLLLTAESTGADLVGCDYSMVSTQCFTPGQQVSCNRAEQTGLLDDKKRASLLLDPGSLVTKIYRRHLVCDGKTPLFPEGIFYEDNAVSGLLMMRATRFEYLPEPLYYYYQHDASTVHRTTVSRLRNRMEAGRILLAHAREEGYLTRFPDEIEFQFTELFFINTFFSALQTKGLAGCYAFTREVAKEMHATFPAFQENRYYAERVHPEEKKLIRMQETSHLKFYVYYRLLHAYRRVRYGA